MKKLLKNRNLSEFDVIYIGDEVRDIEAAKAAGIKMVAVSWGFNSPEILKTKNPDYLIDYPLQLTQLLEQQD